MDRVKDVLEKLLLPEGVVDIAPGQSKRDVVMSLGQSACDGATVKPEHLRAVLDALWDREQILSTGIGLGIAVPHVRHANVPVEVMRVGRSRTGLAFDAIDAKPVHAVFTILMPSGNHRRHVQVLGAIAAAVKEGSRREGIFAAPDSATFVQRMLAST